MRSVEKPITFRSLVDNPAVQKPALSRLFFVVLNEANVDIFLFLSSNWIEITNYRR